MSILILSLDFSCKMKCDDCGSTISGSFFETDGKTICKKDYEDVSILWATSEKGDYSLIFQKLIKIVSTLFSEIPKEMFSMW